MGAAPFVLLGLPVARHAGAATRLGWTAWSAAGHDVGTAQVGYLKAGLSAILAARVVGLG